MIELTKLNVTRINVLFKIISAPFLCLIAIYFIKIDFEYYPVSFAIIMSIINLRKLRLKPLMGLVVNVTSSAIIFFLGYALSLFFISSLKTYLGEDLSGLIGLIIGADIFAPLTLFIVYNYIFKVSKGKLYKFTVAITIAILIIYNCVNYFNYPFLKIDSYLLWQVVMSLAVQLSIYYKELVN